MYEALSYYVATLCTVAVTRVQVALQSVADIKKTTIMGESSLRLSTSQANLFRTAATNCTDLIISLNSSNTL